MFEIVPVEIYAFVHYNILLMVVLLVFFKTRTVSLMNVSVGKFQQGLGLFYIPFFILYLGLRPISGKYFGDMGYYNMKFLSLQNEDVNYTHGDVWWNILTKFLGNFMGPEGYFLTIGFLYVLPCYLFSKKYFNKNWFYGVVFFVASFSFWNFGTNGIRNGLATSIFLLGLYYNRFIITAIFFVLSYNIHGSMLLPIGVYVLTLYSTNLKSFLIGWILAIPISLLSGSFWVNLFSTFSVDERASVYLTEDYDSGLFSYTGFRWDFLIYSAVAVYAGWYYVVKMKYKDELYEKIFATYLGTNAFWILVITANYTNRFAYLSWFLMPIVIMYPILRDNIFKKSHKILGVILFLYFLFTYTLSVIL